jgi:hypothetical protein
MKAGILFFLAGFLVGGWLVRECAAPISGEVRIETNTLVQVLTQARILRVPTDPAGMAALVDELNGYRTGPGWLASSNRRVWAGLQARAWAADYATDADPVLWQAGLWAGTGGAGGYAARRIGPGWLGIWAGYGGAGLMAGATW